MTNKSDFSLYQQTRDIALRNKLVEKHLYMVEILIRKYMNKGVEYDDLYQVGSMALVKAVERFDPSKGFEFSSFATPTILGEIRKYFRDKEWALKVPRKQKEIAGRIPDARDFLTDKLGRTPTPLEIATHLSVPVEEILSAMDAAKAYAPQSLNAAVNENGEEGDTSTLENYLAVEDRGYESVELNEIIEDILAGLSDRERQIFKKRYIENETQIQIAEELGISQMTVSRTEKLIRSRFQEALHR